MQNPYPKEGLITFVNFFSDSFEYLRIDEKLNVKGIRNYGLFKPPLKRYNFKRMVSL